MPPLALAEEIAMLLAARVMEHADYLRTATGPHADRERRRVMDSADWLDTLISERKRADTDGR